MLDLDCLYGSGPVAQPYLYDRADPDKLLIGDPRSDENLIVAQTHLAFLRFHNKVVDWLREEPSRRESPIRKTIFEEARNTVIWHYQWIVIHDTAGAATMGWSMSATRSTSGLTTPPASSRDA